MSLYYETYKSSSRVFNERTIMAKKNSCNCNDVSADDGSLYVVYDGANCELVAEGIEFDDIETVVADYLANNGYGEDDADFTVYKGTSILIEVNTKPKVTVKRN